MNVARIVGKCAVKKGTIGWNLRPTRNFDVLICFSVNLDTIRGYQSDFSKRKMCFEAGNIWLHAEAEQSHIFVRISVSASTTYLKTIKWISV